MIVLDREIGSMTEFKQIIGRGTRIHEDTKKYYFTLIDFRKATNLFADPDFDGDPVQIYEPGPDDPITPPEYEPPTDDGEPLPPEPGEDEVILVDPNIDWDGRDDDTPIQKVLSTASQGHVARCVAFGDSSRRERGGRRRSTATGRPSRCCCDGLRSLGGREALSRV